jgi:shikimate kinase
VDRTEGAGQTDEERSNEAIKNMKTNLALIGYMGTGKTAVGQALAKKLGLKFLELDWLIEKQAGKKIAEIFREKGEIAFRELEIEATKKIAGEKHCVIACGGGIVLNKINIDRLRESAVMVYLTASPGTILKRVAGEKGQRPLLAVADQLKTITDMLKFRKPFYERSADITINTSKMGIAAVAEEIIGKLKEDESFNFKK